MAIVLSGTTGIDAGSLPVANTGKISAGSGLPVILNTAGVDRVTVDTAGNVGIGTGSPDFPLEVVGNDITVKISNNNIGASTTALQIGGFSGFSSGIYGTTLRSIHNFGLTSSSSLAFELAGTERMKLDANGNLLLTSGTGALGYGAGAGGTVTQLTNKETTVTLNKPSGRIIMNNAALAPYARVEYSVLSNLISASDLICVNITGGVSDAKMYRAETVNVATGGGQFRLTNLSGVSLSEAVEVTFIIIKGAHL